MRPVSHPSTVRGRSLAYLAEIPVVQVKGIGPKYAANLEKAGIGSVTDLLLHTPRRYLDRSQIFDLSSVPIGEEVTVGGVVEHVHRRRLSRKRIMTTARISDGTRRLSVIWFNPYLKIAEGDEVALSGKVETFRGGLQMKSPDMDRIGEGEALETGRVVPIHPSVGGLRPFKLRESIANALARSRPISEAVPADILARHHLVDRDAAIADIHFPETRDDADRARDRLVFDELFRLQVALAVRKRRQLAQARGVAHTVRGALLDAFLEALAFPLTGAQERAIGEILRDLASSHPMHRLLQGEVGSGKTVVALLGLLAAVQSGHQGAIMAPTEVLAEQHYLSTTTAVEDAGLAAAGVGAAGTGSLFAETDRPHVGVALLTANSAIVHGDEGASRNQVLARIRDGSIDIVIGTHSLIQEGVGFHRLGLAVVDEQHRFGVYQRVQLRDKTEGYDPDLLIMTATPIPRTLSMTLYGDLDVSVLDEMPPGRTPVTTRRVAKDAASLERVHDHVRREVAAGRQVFVVCPLVEDSAKLEAKSATAEYERLKKVYPELRLGLLHGQLRPAEKDDVMHRFRDGRLDLLVATTVIEVGIDIPNATLMVIEDADRFGLSQLHQLRGRVGRSTHRSTCLLVAEPATPEGERRIEAMVATTDGFRLAEVDLEIRGQGTVLGSRQSGVSDLRLADILRDVDVLVAARREAFALVDADPDLSAHPDLAAEITHLLGEDAEWLERS